MKSKGEQTIASYNKALNNNLNSFERSVERSLKDIPNSQTQAQLEPELKKFIAKGRNDKNRIPEVLSPPLVNLGDTKKDHRKHLQKQSEIDLKMVEQLKPLCDMYIVGLQKKQATLTADHDDGAAAQIDEEIELTRKSPTHFQEIMGCQIPTTTEVKE